MEGVSGFSPFPSSSLASRLRLWQGRARALASGLIDQHGLTRAGGDPRRDGDELRGRGDDLDRERSRRRRAERRADHEAIATPLDGVDADGVPARALRASEDPDVETARLRRTASG